LALRAANDARSPDPLRIMTRAMSGATEDPPEMVFLAWLLSVPAGLDAAAAARALLARYPAHLPDADRRIRLRELLNETARWPARRLAGLRARPNRQPR
jgi:hypothetical protein